MSQEVLEQTAREPVWPEEFKRPEFPYSPAVRAGGWVFASAQMATDLVSGLAPEAVWNQRNPYLSDAVELQSWALMKNLSDVMATSGCDISADSVRIQQWRVSEYPTMEEFEAGSTWTRLSVTPYYRARNAYIAEPRPASTGMGVRRLLLRDGRIAVDLIAIHPGAGAGKRGVGVPDSVPSPLAGYSPAICNGDWVFLAGEIPTDWQGDFMSERHLGPLGSVAPEARVNPYFWYGSPIEAQTDYTLKKLDAIAEAAGTSLDRCVKANVYIGHPSDYEGMDRVWRQWFPDDPPARVVIPYMGLGGMGCRIEIDMILLANDSQLVRQAVSADSAFEPLGHEPQAMQAGDFLFFSTQVSAGREGIEPELLGNPEFPYFTDSTQLQADRIFDNMAALCEAAGTTLDEVCQIREFYEDLGSFRAVRDEWSTRFGNGAPASTTVEVGAPLIVPGCRLLLDATAYVPQGE
jgi:enamine deaminase RidA (YjgF/YER057c/UK114 family)